MNMSDGTFQEFPSEIGRIFAFGLTYEGHIRESGERPGEPVIFDKTCAVTVEPETVSAPSSSQMFVSLEHMNSGIASRLRNKFPSLPALLDYEIELGFVVLEEVTSEKLGDRAWMPKVGYFLANDVTARSVQIAGQLADNRYDYWSASKSFDGFLPVANKLWIPSSPSGNTFPDVRLQLKVNGTVRQSEAVADLIYSPREMIDIVCQDKSDGILNVGDVILTGTPSGVALGMSKGKQIMAKLLPPSLLVRVGIDSNRKSKNFLRPGDLVEHSAEWLGEFSFVVS